MSGFAWPGSGSGGGGRTLLEEQLLSSDGVFDLQNIPADFEELLIDIRARSDASGHPDAFTMIVNGDTGSNYLRGRIWQTTSANAAVDTAMNAGYVSGNTASAGHFSTTRMRILGYADPDKKKVIDVRNVVENRQDFVSLSWDSLAVINRIQLQPQGGDFFKAGSFCRVYGVPKQ